MNEENAKKVQDCLDAGEPVPDELVEALHAEPDTELTAEHESAYQAWLESRRT